MTKGGYMIAKKKGKVKEVFGSAAKEKRFDNENRRGHRSEYRKPKGLRILVPTKHQKAKWLAAHPLDSAYADRHHA
jgi:hypothetical protein